MQVDCGRGQNQARRAFPLDKACLEALARLLDRLIAESALREQRPHQIAGKVASQAGGLIDHKDAMTQRLLRIGERVL